MTAATPSQSYSQRNSQANSQANSIAVSFWRFTQKERRASLFIPLAILSALALVSYLPQDPSLNTATFASEHIHNWLGKGGAFFADLLIQIFGKAAWGITAVLISLSIPSHKTTLARTTCIALSLTLAALAAALLAPEATNNYPAGGGGILGEIFRNATYTNNPNLQNITLAISALAAITLFLAATPNLPKASLRAVIAILNNIRNATTLASQTAQALAHTFAFRAEQPILLRTPLATQSPHPLQNTPTQQTHQQPPQPPQPPEPEPPTYPRSEETAEEIAEQELVSPPQEGAQNSKVEQTPASSSPSTSPASSSFQVPPLSLLSAAGDKNAHLPTRKELDETSQRLEQTLSDYGVRGAITDIQCGPVITLYTLDPAPGVKASRVVSLAEDIARTMQRVSVRIAVIPGKNGIGIELPNKQRQTVVLKELLEAASPSLFLPLALGKASDGTPQIADLADMPHLLIAGTTGAGKSVGINAMILSLLYRHAPQDCRLILIDPKMLELAAYQDIPHLLAPVITEPEKALSALRWTVLEMERRYRTMAELSVRNIEGYRRKLRLQKNANAETMPYIVVVIDEMADLMLTSGRNIEGVLQRLAQMARAAGIHLIVATQRPSVDVVTGTVKANFPTRLSYRVASKFDSRTILNEQGAETLLGRGDMLFMPGGGKITRIHGPFVGEEEVEAVCNFLRQQSPPDYREEILEVKPKTTLASLEGEGEDPLYSQAVGVVVKHQRASTSFLQRQLQIGYNRAARIIERMEQEGKISLADATGKRRVLLQQASDEENFESSS